jgi:hypothetical protein
MLHSSTSNHQEHDFRTGSEHCRLRVTDLAL